MQSSSPSPAAMTPSQREAAKRVILLTVFLDILGFGIIIPQLGVYASQFGASGAMVGVLASTYSAMGFLFTPFWGRLSDRIGRRPVMLYSIFGTGLGYILFAFAQSMPLLFAARIIDGVTGANISTAQAYLSDITPPEDRSKTFGLFGAIFGVGFAIGPLIGSLIAYLPGIWGGNFGLGIITAALSFINWALAVVRLPETLSPAIREANLQSDRERSTNGRAAKWQVFNLSGFTRAFALPRLRLLFAISFFATAAFATLQGTYSLFLIQGYVRPIVQAQINANPAQAIKQAQQSATSSASSKTAPAIGSETGSDAAPEASESLDKPYPRELGGDIKTVPQYPLPQGYTWQRVEKLMVRPRAAQMAAWVFAAIGLTSLFVQGGIVRSGKLQKKFGEVGMVMGGTLLMALGLALVPLPHVFYGQFPVMALLALGNSVATPVVSALVSEFSPENERGELLGVFQSLGSLGRIVGPNLGGFLFDRFTPAAPYLAGGLIMFISFVFSLGLRGKTPNIVPQAAES